MMREYTLVFIFDLKGDRLLMIHKSSKNSPSVVYDKFNAVGGKIEPGETPAAGATREVEEETGIKLTGKSLHNFALLTDDKNFKIHCFCTFTNKISQFQQKTKEKLEIFQTKMLPSNVVNNLHYLIPMAKNFEKESADFLIIKEVYEV